MPDFDLNALNLDELQRLESLVHVELQARQERERRALVRKLKAVAEREGIALEQLYEDSIAPSQSLLGRSRGKPDRRREKAKPKYQNPEGKTWTGRGKMPVWVREYVESGKPLADLLIEQPGANTE